MQQGQVRPVVRENIDALHRVYLRCLQRGEVFDRAETDNIESADRAVLSAYFQAVIALASGFSATEATLLWPRVLLENPQRFN